MTLQTTGATLLFANASACGKVILTGEHAVVYGNEAIAVPLSSRQITITLKAKCESRHQKRQRGLPQFLLSQAFSLLNVQEPNVQLYYFSNLPISAGLGSSAALSMAVLRAAANYCQIYLSKEEEAELTNKMEVHFHNTPSGIDANVIAHEKVIVFRKGSPVAPLKIKAPHISNVEYTSWPFVLIYSAEKKSTKEMLDKTSVFFAADQQKTLLAQFAASSTLAKQGLSNGDIETLGYAMNLAHKLLSEIGIVTNKMHEIITNCLSLGVIAAKSTGAGGGGFILALLNPSRRVEQLGALQELYGKGRVIMLPLFC